MKLKRMSPTAWYQTTAEGNELLTLAEGRRLRFCEVLEWLESAETLVLQMHGRQNLNSHTGVFPEPSPLQDGARLRTGPQSDE